MSLMSFIGVTSYECVFINHLTKRLFETLKNCESLRVMFMCRLYHQNRNNEERGQVLVTLYLLITAEARPAGMAESTLDLLSR